MELKDKIWWTRKSRIQSEQRLLSHAFHADFAILIYAFYSCAIGVYYLKLANNSEYSSITWLAFSILIFGLSGFVNGLNYKGRALLMKDCYEKLSTLYHKAYTKEVDEIAVREEYSSILNLCENHKEWDHQLAVCKEYLGTKDKKKLTKHPTFWDWFCFISFHIFKVATITLLYTLPLLLFMYIEWENLA